MLPIKISDHLPEIHCQWLGQGEGHIWAHTTHDLLQWRCPHQSRGTQRHGNEHLADALYHCWRKKKWTSVTKSHNPPVKGWLIHNADLDLSKCPTSTPFHHTDVDTNCFKFIINSRPLFRDLPIPRKLLVCAMMMEDLKLDSKYRDHYHPAHPVRALTVNF